MPAPPDGHRSWWDVSGDWVEPPNRRRGGLSGVQRFVDPGSGATYYIKRQVNHTCRSLRHPLGRPTLLREWRNLHRCAELGVPTADPVFFAMRRGPQGWEAILVTRGLVGYTSLHEAIAGRLWSPARQREALLALAEALAPLHKARRKHGHLYPKEIFVCGASPPRIALLDWEVARHGWFARRAARSDLGRLWASLTLLGVGTADRQAFLQHYEACAGLGRLNLPGMG